MMESKSIQASDKSEKPPTVPSTDSTGNFTGILHLAWEFTESNFSTFVLPNTAFGVLGALAGNSLIRGPTTSFWTIFFRLPLVVLFNLYNVLNFDLANQTSPKAVDEDRLNKPWRPIPTGKVTSKQARRAMLVTVPLAIGLNYLFGVHREGLFIQIITWLYNDVGGGDELVRDLIIGIAFGFFNEGSLKIAVGSATPINKQGYTWIVLVSGLIITTMQVQDLKDQDGDKVRGRQTIPLVFGERFSRLMIASLVPFWSIVCASFWQLHTWGYVAPTILSAYISFRALTKRGRLNDDHLWRLWCLWTAVLYLLPVCHRAQLAISRDTSVLG